MPRLRTARHLGHAVLSEVIEGHGALQPSASQSSLNRRLQMDVDLLPALLVGLPCPPLKFGEEQLDAPVHRHAEIALAEPSAAFETDRHRLGDAGGLRRSIVGVYLAGLLVVDVFPTVELAFLVAVCPISARRAMHTHAIRNAGRHIPISRQCTAKSLHRMN